MTSCYRTRNVYIPATPCSLTPFPELPAATGTICGKSICYTPEDDYEITKWMIQVKRWRAEVRSCSNTREKPPVSALSAYTKWHIYNKLIW